MKINIIRQVWRSISNRNISNKFDRLINFLGQLRVKPIEINRTKEKNVIANIVYRPPDSNLN